MSALNRSALSSSFVTNLPDNNSGLITPEILRGELINIVDSAVFPEDSGSIYVSTSSFHSFTASIQTQVNDLAAVTASYADTGSNIFVGNQTITGSLIVSSSEGLSNTGPLTQTGDTTIVGDLIVTGSQIITGSLTISGSDTLTNIGPFNQTGISNIAGNTTISGSLILSGSDHVVSGSSLNVIAPTSINGTVDIIGNTDIQGDTDITGSLGILGNSSLNGDISVTGNSTVTGNATINGDTTISGSLLASGSHILEGDLTVKGLDPEITIQGTTVNGDQQIKFKSENGNQMFFMKSGVTNNIFNQFSMGAGSSETDLVIDNNGNVGVGTHTPSEELTVSGSISASGDFLLLGSVTTTNITASGNISGSATSTLTIGGAATFGTSTVVIDGTAGHITASGNISASGDIIANSFTGNISPSNITQPFTNITASGDISASGVINGQNLFGGVFGRIYPDSSQTSNNQFFTADANGINSNSSFAVTGNVTASGNISASGNIFGVGYHSNGAIFAQFDSGIINLGGAVLNPAALTGTSITLGMAGQNQPVTIISALTASSNISGSSTTVFSGNQYRATSGFRMLQASSDVLLNSNNLPILSHDNSGTPIVTSLGSDDIGGSNLSQVRLITDQGEILAVSGSTVTVGANASSPHGTEALNVRGNVSSSGFGLFQAGKPIVTHTTKFSASLSHAGFYNIVGGDLTCSISTSLAPVGAEFELFQTSSTGNFLFETGSGVTLISKNNSLRLAQQGSSAVLKKVSDDTYHLMGDLT